MIRIRNCQTALLVLCLLGTALRVPAEDSLLTNPAAIHIAFPDERLEVNGLGWWKEEKILHRLPERLKPTIPPKVWDLAQRAAGVRIRLRTDSPTIGLVAKTYAYKYAFMPPVGDVGVDIYVDGRYLGSGLPGADTILKGEWTAGTSRTMRDVMFYLPVGRPSEVQEIILEPGAKVEKPKPYGFDLPIVYYGSSITQGAQASNPGMAFPSVLGRWLNADFINLGFSGNGKGEPALAHAVAELPAMCYVLDYWANPTPEEYRATLPGFVDIIRAKHPTTPIIVTGPYYNPSEITGSRQGGYQLEKRKIAPAFVEQRRQAGDKNIHYIDGLEIISPDTADALSDGRHPNSLGMFYYARVLEPHLRRLLSLPPPPPR